METLLTPANGREKIGRFSPRFQMEFYIYKTRNFAKSGHDNLRHLPQMCISVGGNAQGDGLRDFNEKRRLNCEFKLMKFCDKKTTVLQLTLY